MIKNSLPNKSGNPESLKKLSQQFKRFSTNVPIVMRICWGHSTGCFIYSFAIQVINEKTLRSKDLTSNLREIFLHENNRNYNSYRFD